MTLSPLEAMKLAIEEGKKGAGFVSPNPLVGAVILDRHYNLVGLGHHQRVGHAHAEVNALKEIENPGHLDGAHVFVTLEPCAHEGRTPSCAKTLAELPIASVTYGLKDPNPLVAGKGAQILREAGKTVALFTDLQDELEELSEIFLMNMRFKRPFVAVKVASSLDGRIALGTGESQWITNEESRAHVQYLRGCYDAVLTGAGTFLRDDPRLNSRDAHFTGKNQRVVLLDPSGKSFAKLEKSQLWSVRKPEDIFVITGPLGLDAPEGISHVEIPDADGAFEMTALMEALMEAEIHSLFVEAGAYTVSSFLKARLVDRLYLFQAPKILGEGMSWTSGFTLSSIQQAPILRHPRLENFGDDFLVTGRLH
jgi:diaminohydroxyphosphoribosylaminopyrimidine deaminase/5-amino-6-(5-phosphoribosylamino)uracil reductase